MTARIGRRMTALLLLVTIGVTMATNASCMLPAVDTSSETASAHPHRHVPAHPHGEGSGMSADTESHPGVPSDRPAHEPNHETDGCGMLMACGLAAPAAQVLDVAFTADPIETRVALIRDDYDSPSLTFEPPPPRDLLS